MNTSQIDNFCIGDSQVDKLYLGTELIWESTPAPSVEPFTIKVTAPGNILFRKYSGTAVLPGVQLDVTKNGQPFESVDTDITTSYTWSAVAGDVFEFVATQDNAGLGRRANSTLANASYHTFSGTTAGFEVEGHIMSLIDTNYETNNTFAASQVDTTTTSITNNFTAAFIGLLRACSGLTSASNLVLPTDLAYYCYGNMFKGSTALASAPEILADGMVWTSYSVGWLESMFSGCGLINYVKCTIQGTGIYFTEFLFNVSSTGTLVKNPNATWVQSRGWLPTTWTIVDAQ